MNGRMSLGCYFWVKDVYSFSSIATNSVQKTTFYLTVCLGCYILSFFQLLAQHWMYVRATFLIFMMALLWEVMCFQYKHYSFNQIKASYSSYKLLWREADTHQIFRCNSNKTTRPGIQTCKKHYQGLLLFQKVPVVRSLWDCLTNKKNDEWTVSGLICLLRG